ncbi:MAG: hypothetical protein JRL30_11060 [Deltaproteobacteria bacterium]|nr:hypothetical protein [Deltaproteobacteria bacterium]
MVFVGIVGARKYQDRRSVIDLVEYLPSDSVIVTSACRGVCAWARDAAERRSMVVEVFAPDLSNIRSNFEVAERYYQRNRELIERCDLVHAFLSEEDGCTGGTGFEVEYASKIGRPVELHWENRESEMLYQYTFPFETRAFHLAWQDFFTMTFA